VSELTSSLPARSRPPVRKTAGVLSAAVSSGTTAGRSTALVVTLSLCGTSVSIVHTAVTPLLPRLPALTACSPRAAGWLLTITLLTGAVLTPVLSRAGDMYGRRRVLLWSLAGLVAGSLMCAGSSRLPVLLTGRALQGAALAVLPLAMGILREHLPAERVTPSIVLMSSTLGIGSAAGVPLSALLLAHADWHLVFWLLAGLGILCVTLVMRFVPGGSDPAEGRFDTVGAVGLAVAVACLLLAVAQGGQWGWTSRATLGLLAAAAVTGLVWGAYESRADCALLDLRTSLHPTVLMANLGSLLIGFAFYANSLTTAQLVQEPAGTGYGLGADVVVSGLCLLPSGLAMLLLSPLSGRISARWGPRTSLMAAALCIAAGYAVRYFTSHSLGAIILGAAIVAGGTAIAYPALPTLIIGAVPASQTAAANGINTLMRTVGQAVCSAVTGSVLSRRTVSADGFTAPALGAYLLIFLICGGAALTAFVLALLMGQRQATV
jgi:predicted MFS family arabinose efflux permease